MGPILFKNNNLNINDEIVNINEAVEDGKLNPWYYEMHDLGYNYRITDIQCALGISQLKKLDRFVDRRRELALRYDKLFSNSCTSFHVA